jgi:hypothetical protein
MVLVVPFLGAEAGLVLVLVAVVVRSEFFELVKTRPTLGRVFILSDPIYL